ncbi:MAG: hypothetical protein ACT6T0_03655 [Nevskia sp.]|uniref:hypothetical protein n=1 Tax=Nevskia sp. TaxID=1929292 RepID=UPI0040367C4C
MSSLPSRTERGRLTLLMHGAAIGVIGLVSGFGLVFAILDAWHVWPVTLPITLSVPGSEHGWRVAHVAGVLNGMLMMLGGLALVPTAPGPVAQRWIVGGLVWTGWGNTVFFHLANASSNRALSAGSTRLGEADPAGIAGYLIGASTIPFTIIALALLGLAAARQLRQR